ncbi:MAG TPA: hypothetical protein VGQ85_01650 [Candidatus Limnocylindrales bacterium]|nr:hypothetical protein [Candidatus Limnocylindrales bacterium]
MDHVEPTTRLSRFTPTARKTGRLHDALKDAVRLTIVAGAVLLVVGSFLSWLEVYLPFRGWFDMSSFERANDGGITLELGVLLFALAWSDRATSSRLAVLVGAPAAIGIVAVLDLRVASDSLQAYLDSIAISGGKGYFLPGFWMTVGGATLATLAGVVRIWRVRRETRWAIGVRRSTAGAFVGGVGGAIVGFAAGIFIGERVGANIIGGAAGSVLVLFAIAFGFAGTWLGAWAGRLVGSAFHRS